MCLASAAVHGLVISSVAQASTVIDVAASAAVALALEVPRVARGGAMDDAMPSLFTPLGHLTILKGAVAATVGLMVGKMMLVMQRVMANSHPRLAQQPLVALL